ncbi:heat stress transcription factor A-6b isoform X2 [Malania oleifera]|uniref:heat stress transcription factor A-6b isoform X2 n=1 Tax=Malania oleifera TaxID=397392 RepID=UPI0025AE47AF|nr:heat stress transcription factor A-6b isoform X2 [Malania oleifera]
MDHAGMPEEEFQGASSSYSGEPSIVLPQPIEGLHDAGPPPFLTKTHDLVDDRRIDHIVSWSREGSCFVVWDPQTFAMNILPRYFKHNNFSSFVRQLNTYGFRKVDSDRWEFANEWFLRGQKHLLKNIRRRRTPPLPQALLQALDPCVEVGYFGLERDVGRLRHDKQILMVELAKVRQEQQSTRAYLQTMEQRLRATELKQKLMMKFLARALSNPGFIQQLVHQDKRKELEQVLNKKRRRPIDRGPSIGEEALPVKAEPYDYGDNYTGFEFSELERLALDMQGLSRTRKRPQEEEAEQGKEYERRDYKSLDEGFWEELLNEGIEDDMSLIGARGEDEETVNVLAERLGFLGSSPK